MFEINNIIKYLEKKIHIHFFEDFACCLIDRYNLFHRDKNICPLQRKTVCSVRKLFKEDCVICYDKPKKSIAICRQCQNYTCFSCHLEMKWRCPFCRETHPDYVIISQDFIKRRSILAMSWFI